MTREEFDNLVQRLERRYARSPAWFRLQLAGWVALGYFSFLSWLLLAIALGFAAFVGGASVELSGGIWLLVVGGLLLTMGVLQTAVLLSVRLEPPRGRRLEPADAPRLFALLRELRGDIRCRVDRVILTADFNAAVQQLPRLGVFGWWRSDLFVGLPLLHVLSPDELRAVLAHEFAHLSGAHGRFGNWVYRLRWSWERLFQQLHTGSGAGTWLKIRNLVVRFVDWYWPRFNARAFVMCRAHEYFADEVAARVAGAPHVALSLWRIECFGRQLGEKFWVEMWRLANKQPLPPDDLIARLHASLAAPPEPAEALRWMELIKSQLTDNSDTHPCFSDRLWSFGLSEGWLDEQRFPALPPVSAARYYFEENLGPLEREISADWQKEATREWRSRHGRVGTLQRRLESLGQAVADPDSDPATLWEKTRAVLDIEGPAAAETLLLRLLGLQPTHYVANLVLGRHWLDQGKAEGETLLERVLDSDDERLVPQAGELLAAHFRNAGDTGRLKDVRSRLDRFEAAVVASQRERSSVLASDRFLPHELSPEELQPLVELLEGQSALFAAWLARKDLQHFPKQRLFVLCVRSRPNFWGRSSPETDAALANRLIGKVRLPGRVLIIAPQGGFRALGRRIMSLPRAQIVSR